MKKLMLVATVLMGLSALSVIGGGYVLTVLWAWFVVPTFALPQITLAAAIGLAIVVGYMTHQYTMGLIVLDANPPDARAVWSYSPGLW